MKSEGTKLFRALLNAYLMLFFSVILTSPRAGVLTSRGHENPNIVILLPVQRGTKGGRSIFCYSGTLRSRVSGISQKDFGFVAAAPCGCFDSGREPLCLIPARRFFSVILDTAHLRSCAGVQNLSNIPAGSVEEWRSQTRPNFLL